MATTLIHTSPSAGCYVKRGATTSIDDAGTIDTSLVRVDGAIFGCNTADTVVSLTSQSVGVMTVAIKTAGAAASGVTVYWEAWCETRKG